ncbi:MAG: replication-associated recombination protein A [Gammaproteobacteria bacterium]|nr:replication-associated recombination protein A [Pseudomonadales bacterium]MCP5346194.1 replication-associated recombination protein A [Pseudomonadales bacterium]
MADSLLQEDPPEQYQPLAARMRPRNLDQFIGQEHILAPGKALYQAIRQGSMHSMVFWGPPGVGKTTLARIIAATTDSRFESLSAVLSGVKDIREAVERARHYRQGGGRQTLLFVDEVHRFNKSQQDAFLPHIEDGTIIFIGATTENPAFELNNALLSRSRVYVLKSLSETQLLNLLELVLTDSERGLGHLALRVDEQARQALARASDGDARRLLNLLEIAADLAGKGADGLPVIDRDTVARVTQESLQRFDKGGDLFYDQISALHKAVRGSSPDAALYWFTRMLDGGCDPLYIARRMLRMASEDIGNADPRALQLALAGWDTYQRLGSPEGDLALAQVVIYLACAPKSNAVYQAAGSARETVRQTGTLEVPLHLRNAVSDLARELGHGDGYRYAHDEAGGFAAGENYFPESLQQAEFYFPREAGLEVRIREKLEHLKQQNRASGERRYQEDRAGGRTAEPATNPSRAQAGSILKAGGKSRKRSAEPETDKDSPLERVQGRAEGEQREK